MDIHVHVHVHGTYPCIEERDGRTCAYHAHVHVSRSSMHARLGRHVLHDNATYPDREGTRIGQPNTCTA